MTSLLVDVVTNYRPILYHYQNCMKKQTWRFASENVNLRSQTLDSMSVSLTRALSRVDGAMSRTPP